MTLALYVHIPFCAARCAYCDFNTYAGQEALWEAYSTALNEEIRRASGTPSEPLTISSIFLGGGTPTVWPARLLGDVLATIGKMFTVEPDVEISCEANPGTVDQPYLAFLRSLGINRLSLGVQSFDDEELRWLGRIHNAEEAVAACTAAHEAGFTNVSLDLIYGLPGQDPAKWRATLAAAVAQGPTHLSLYSLTVEPHTPLARAVHRGLAVGPDPDAQADCYEVAGSLLTAAGYSQYEISNWARPGFTCRHNQVYWRHEPYLGFGAGAVSCDERRRWWNVKRPQTYIQRIKAGRTPEAGGETITPRLLKGELLMLGLRLTAEGVTYERFRQRCGIELEECYALEIGRLAAEGLLERLPDRIRLTPRGRLLGNRVFSAFV